MNKMAEMNKKVEISKKTVMLQSMLTMLILVLMMFCEAFSVQASDQFSGEKSQTVVTADTKTMPILSVKSAFQNTARSKSTVTPTPKPKNGLRKEGHAYRYYVNNKPVRNQWKKVKGKYYWLKANGVAAHDGHYNVNGVYYVFDKNAQRMSPGKKSIVKVSGRRYLVDAEGRAVTGWNELNGKMYYAYRSGRCAADKTVGGIRFNKKGYASNLTQARCKLAAREFIARHSDAGMSNYDKFYSCFRYLMAYTNFGGYMDPTPEEFRTKDWVYKYSLQMFQNGLTGNCYGIAGCVAAVAKELGYEPYVITIPEGHSFVMINGLYYDNMYGTLFGADTRPAYTVEYQIKF